jgi:hypothetical protein
VIVVAGVIVKVFASPFFGWTVIDVALTAVILPFAAAFCPFANAGAAIKSAVRNTPQSSHVCNFHR